MEAVGVMQVNQVRRQRMRGLRRLLQPELEEEDQVAQDQETVNLQKVISDTFFINILFNICLSYNLNIPTNAFLQISKSQCNGRM